MRVSQHNTDGIVIAADRERDRPRGRDGEGPVEGGVKDRECAGIDDHKCGRVAVGVAVVVGVAEDRDPGVRRSGGGGGGGEERDEGRGAGPGRERAAAEAAEGGGGGKEG